MDVGTLFSIFFTLGDIVTVIDLLYMGEKGEEDSGMKFSCSWLLLTSGGMVDAIDVTNPSIMVQDESASYSPSSINS